MMQIKVDMNTDQGQVKRSFLGKVISNKMEKTCVVEVVTTYTHRKFRKVLRKSKKYAVHDEHNAAKVGDFVEFCSGRPVSKTKHMYLVRVITKAQ